MCEVNQGLHYASPVALEPFTGCVRTATSLVSSGPYFYNETKTTLMTCNTVHGIVSQWGLCNLAIVSQWGLCNLAAA